MLALTRRIGEEIVIGDPADPLGVIRIVAVHGDKVRLSFDFPRDVKINRRELADMKAKGEAPPDNGNGPVKPPVDPNKPKPPVDSVKPPVDPNKPPADPNKPPVDPNKPAPGDPTKR